MRRDDRQPPTTDWAAASQEASGPKWRKALCSGAENGGCVEIGTGLAGLTGIRDSRRPGDGAHFVSAVGFTAFLTDAKAGVYDFKPD